MEVGKIIFDRAYLPENTCCKSVSSDEPIDKYQNIGRTIGKLVDRKQMAYGDSFNKSVKIIETLYPDGIKTDQYADFLALIRVIDKLFRIVTDRDALGESPWKDIAGYGILKSGGPE